ncbi:MAG: DUF5318 domain-containing protein [Candidatus Nanopelagicales bacterium]|jgi:hypothetical protein|nr:DUF5318 domain-containing protein [Candidatus Nanopelagicales bacterium]
MAAPRSSTIRGTRTAAPTKSPAPHPDEFAPEVVDDPEAPRDVVSFALARRAALETMRRGGAFNSDYCDADPGLLRAAKYHGEDAGRACPVCRRTELVEVTWVYGAQLGPLSGSARAQAQLTAMAHEHGRFTVYVVEVCRHCTWNHMVLSFALGDGQPRTPARIRRRT